MPIPKRVLGILGEIGSLFFLVIFLFPYVVFMAGYALVHRGALPVPNEIDPYDSQERKVGWNR